MLGSILGIAGLAASAFGGKDQKVTSEQKTGFQALPKEIQDYLLESYLPRVQDYGESPYPSVPMERATNPADDPFASQALYDLQRYSDYTGGLFSPYTQDGTAPEAAATPAPQSTGMDGAALAQQYLMGLSAPQMGSPRGYRVGRGSFSSDIADRLNRSISTGQFDLGALGDALSDQGYGTSTLTPAGIDVNALYEVLRK